MPDSSDHARALAYLESHHTMSIATCSARQPWNAAVFYVNHGFDLFFVSSADTLHGRHIAENARVAVTIHEDYADWQSIQGVQIAGIARVVSGTERGRVMQRYRSKFAFLRSRDGAGAAVDEALKRSEWYHVAPQRVLFIDNGQGFGYRAEITLPASRQAP